MRDGGHYSRSGKHRNWFVAVAGQIDLDGMLLFNLVGNIHTARSDGLQILQQGTKRRCERRVAFSLLHTLGVGAKHFCAQLEEFGARELELFAINVDIADETDDRCLVHIDELERVLVQILGSCVGIFYVALLDGVDIFIDVLEMLGDAIQIVDDEHHICGAIGLRFGKLPTRHDRRQKILRA